MLNFMKNCFQRDKSMAKNKKKVTYTVETEVIYNDPGDWKRKVRAMRKTIKASIEADKAMKVLRVANKQEA